MSGRCGGEHLRWQTCARRRHTAHRQGSHTSSVTPKLRCASLLQLAPQLLACCLPSATPLSVLATATDTTTASLHALSVRSLMSCAFMSALCSVCCAGVAAQGSCSADARQQGAEHAQEAAVCGRAAWCTRHQDEGCALGARPWAAPPALSALLFAIRHEGHCHHMLWLCWPTAAASLACMRCFKVQS